MSQPWSHYFGFETATRFEVDGPLGYNGTGRVVERGDRRLEFEMHLDAWGPAPAFHATLVIEYRAEGAGNTVVLRRHGEPEKRDDNATITSDDGERRRRIQSADIVAELGYEDEDEVDVDIGIGGDSWDFDFNRLDEGEG